MKSVLILVHTRLEWRTTNYSCGPYNSASRWQQKHSWQRKHTWCSWRKSARATFGPERRHWRSCDHWRNASEAAQNIPDSQVLILGKLIDFAIVQWLGMKESVCTTFLMVDTRSNSTPLRTQTADVFAAKDAPRPETSRIARNRGLPEVTIAT